MGLPLDEGRPGLTIWLVALVGALGAGAAHTHATASAASDLLLAAGLGAVVVVAASLAPPSTWALASAAVTLIAAGGWMAAGAVACGLSVLAVVKHDLPVKPAVGAVVGAVVVQALLRLPPGNFAGHALASTVAIACLLAGSWPRIGPPARRWLRRVASAAAVLAGLATAGLLLALALARGDLEHGSSRAQAGLHQVRRGNSDRAATLLDGASGAFSSAQGRLDAWWARPARLVPIVGQHARALSLISGAGSHLASAAADATRSARLDDLQVTDGRLDLDQVRATAAPLATVRAALRQAQRDVADAHSPWLVSPIAHRIRQFDADVSSAAYDAATASQAVAVLPDIMGGAGTRFYFVVFGTPAETRDLGGFMGAFAVLKADQGKLSLYQTGRVRDLNRVSVHRTLSDRSVFPSHLLALQPERFWQNITGTADFPTVAEAVHQMWSRQAPAQLDGALYMDPDTLAALLHLTGPIRVPDYDKPLTARTAASFLLKDQYVAFPDDNRHDFLVEAAKTVFSKLTSGRLPPPRVIADTLLPEVHERRLLMNSFRPAEEAVFARLRMDGALPAIHGDFLSVRASNRGLSKIDAMMRRTVAYAVTADPSTGSVHSTVTVTVKNEAPATGLPFVVIGNHIGQPQGTNSTTLSVYTPLNLIDVTRDGRPIPRGASSDSDRFRYTALLDVPAGQTVTVVFELAGQVDLRDGYHLDVVPQPLVNPDQLRVTVGAAPGWVPGSRSTVATDLREIEHVDVALSALP